MAIARDSKVQSLSFRLSRQAGQGSLLALDKHRRVGRREVDGPVAEECSHDGSGCSETNGLSSGPGGTARRGVVAAGGVGICAGGCEGH